MEKALIIRAADPQDPDAVGCLRAYYRELGERLNGGFDVTLSRDPEADDMRPPRGGFWIAETGGTAVACIGLKGGSGDMAEIKRLWVSPSVRRRRLARRLLNAAEDGARQLGVTALRLDTNSALPEASALYRATGWSEIERFNDDPYPDLFFEKHL